MSIKEKHQQIVVDYCCSLFKIENSHKHSYPLIAHAKKIEIIACDALGVARNNRPEPFDIKSAFLGKKALRLMVLLGQLNALTISESAVCVAEKLQSDDPLGSLNLQLNAIGNWPKQPPINTWASVTGLLNGIKGSGIANQLRMEEIAEQTAIAFKDLFELLTYFCFESLGYAAKYRKPAPPASRGDLAADVPESTNCEATVRVARPEPDYLVTIRKLEQSTFDLIIESGGVGALVKAIDGPKYKQHLYFHQQILLSLNVARLAVENNQTRQCVRERPVARFLQAALESLWVWYSIRQGDVLSAESRASLRSLSQLYVPTRFTEKEKVQTLQVVQRSIQLISTPNTPDFGSLESIQKVFLNTLHAFLICQRSD